MSADTGGAEPRIHPADRDGLAVAGRIAHRLNLKAQEAATMTSTTLQLGVSQLRAALTPREQSVLEGMARGRSNSDIGRELYLSEDTIKTHARRLFRKLGARDRAHAVALAYQTGLLGADDTTETDEDSNLVWHRPEIPTITLAATDEDASVLANAIWPRHMDRAVTIVRAREALARLIGSEVAPAAAAEPSSPACRSCYRPLLWLRTSGGKNMPVDPDPVLGGNLLVDTHRGTVEAVSQQARDDARERGEPLHVSHLSTCPYADEYRRRGGER